MVPLITPAKVVLVLLPPTVRSVLPSKTLMLGVGFAAALSPARRGMRIQASDALRVDT